MANGSLLDGAAVREMTLTPVEPDEITGLALVIERLAINPDVDVVKLEKIIELQERVMRLRAKADFDSAVADMQGDIPAIIERGKTNNGTYAPLEDIVAAVRPILQRHGFSLSHETQWPDAKTVRVIGILTHRNGHEKRSEFLSSADVSGSKNAIQGLGSAIAYGRRYTTKDLLNIVTRGEDDDGKAAGQKPQPDVPPPDGFGAWWEVLEPLANDGFPALSAAWEKTDDKFKNHLLKTNREGWDALKKKALAIKGAGK